MLEVYILFSESFIDKLLIEPSKWIVKDNFYNAVGIWLCDTVFRKVFKMELTKHTLFF